MGRKTPGAAILTVAAMVTATFAFAEPGRIDDASIASEVPGATPIAGGQATAWPTQAATAQPAAAAADGGIYPAVGSIASTGWQLAEGAYYLGGEFLETGRIVGTQIGGVLGFWPSRNEPATEDAQLRAWMESGHKDLTPVLPNNATRPAAQASDRDSPRPAGAATTPQVPTLEMVAIRKPSATVSDHGCTWAQVAPRESAEAEAAVMTGLTELDLLDEPAVRLPDGAVFLPKVTQRLLQIRTAYPCKGSVAPTRTLVGHVIADPTASGLVQASQDGRIEKAAWGLPRLGQQVVEGEVLAYLRPIWSIRDRAEIEARIATLRGEIAEKELELARSRELPMLPFRQGRILSIRLELDKLRQNRDALVEGLEGARPILATASGVIARADARVGQVVHSQHLLWEIVDGRRLWVEADWTGGNPPSTIPGASAMRADGTPLALAYEGGGWAMKAQSTPLQFRVTNPMPGLRVGERVTVLVREPIRAEGVLVPRSALIRRGNGETGVWVATTAERFESFRVRWKPVDGSSVVVEAGLPEGSRVVVSGAALLAEVR